MAVKFPDPIKWGPQNALRFFIIAPDKEVLPFFNDMGKAVIGGIAHVTEINSGGVCPVGRIDHVTEGPVFIAFPAGLYGKVSEPPVKYGVKGIYVYLVKPPC